MRISENDELEQLLTIKEVIVGGIPVLAIKYELSHDEQVLLMRIRECQRQANIGGIVHEPSGEFEPDLMADIPVDEEFSKLCSEVLG